ncbi:hypothetical protein D3C81_1945400 [compost metagenome]
MQVQCQHNGVLGITYHIGHGAGVDYFILCGCARLKRNCLTGFLGEIPHGLEILAGSVSAVVPQNHAIRILHRHDLEDVVVA